MQAEAARNTKALYPTPGFTPLTVGIPDVGTRGGIVANGRCFFVIATGLYEIFADGTWILRGRVAQDNNPASLAYNGLVGGQLAIASGSNLYSYILATNTLALQVAGEATMVAFANNRFLAFNIANGHVRLSALNDGTIWDSTLFFIRVASDPCQALFVDSQSLIWLVGTETYEAWYVTTDPLNPFAPLSGLVGKYGIASSFGWTLVGNQIFWLVANREGAGTVITAQAGGRAISTYAVDTAIAGYQRTAKISDAEAWSYHDQGHSFAVWNFPSAPATWAYDADQPSWAERGRWTGARYDLWTPRVHVFAFGKHLVGDRTTGTIAVMDATVGTELDGQPIRRVRRAPGLTQEHRRIPLDQFELILDTG